MGQKLICFVFGNLGKLGYIGVVSIQSPEHNDDDNLCCSFVWILKASLFWGSQEAVFFGWGLIAFPKM